jgi:ApeA N-terminal domain 1/Apea-like HEPN
MSLVVAHNVFVREIKFGSPFECTGHWKLAEINGVGGFTYDPEDGLSLTFTGAYDQLESQLACDRGPFAITGRMDRPLAKEVTFLGCHPTKRESCGDETTATFLVNRAFFGSSAGDAVTENVRSAWFTMSALEEWVSPAGPFLEAEPQGAIGARKRFDVYLADPQDLQITVGGASITLKTFIAGSTSRNAAAFEARTVLIVRVPEPRLFDSVLAQFVRPLENFVTLGTGKINALRTLVIERDGQSRTERIDVLFRSVQAKARRSEWLVWPRGLFSLWDVRDSFAERIANWFDLYERRRTVCDQMFYTIYNQQYLESYFLWIVQTVEGYHRRRPDLTQHRLHPKEYRSLKHTASGAVPAESKETVLRAMQHGNDVSLKERLAELLQRYGSLVPAVLTAEERLAFPARCANARNAIAHHLLGDEGLDLERLHKYADFILRLLAAALMSEIGFSEAHVLHAMQHGASLFRGQDRGA